MTVHRKASARTRIADTLRVFPIQANAALAIKA